ncbi:hypothetical protein FA13DRAFT_1653224 [Coprinellus micaceus]|uniref:Peptidase C14 caspase domain-containing protein n=1 Tax=Coprinellus micaceus TaxID=71717 RepID=A0A4Y7RMN7_COPMI|nr:hypothetical protein FA13DRAFT_1653224 [Coprinellus micaceus]
MHALIVGINHFNSAQVMDLTECVDDARRVADYLQSTLLVPRSQIVTLTNTEATKERIVEELKALAHRGSVADDAPIVIYFATHSFVDTATKSTYLVPYPPSENIAGGGLDLDDLKSCALSYNALVDILKHIAEEKTDNITLILDSCHAGAMGQNEKFINPSGQASGMRPRTSEGTRGVAMVKEEERGSDHQTSPLGTGVRGMKAVSRISKKTTGTFTAPLITQVLIVTSIQRSLLGTPLTSCWPERAQRIRRMRILGKAVYSRARF